MAGDSQISIQELKIVKKADEKSKSQVSSGKSSINK